MANVVWASIPCCLRLRSGPRPVVPGRPLKSKYVVSCTVSTRRSPATRV